MPSRKRSTQAVDNGSDLTSRDDGSTILDRIRNMWQFANLCQWIYIFGKSAKIDKSVDIEVGFSRSFAAWLTIVVPGANTIFKEIESECLKPESTLLADLALAILKLVSSHRGLTYGRPSHSPLEQPDQDILATIYSTINYANNFWPGDTETMFSVTMTRLSNFPT